MGIEPEYEFEEVHTWAIAIDRVLVERRPDLFSMDYTKSRRTEKVLLDHNQVGYGRTTASIYSVRPLPEHRFRLRLPGRRSIQEISRQASLLSRLCRSGSGGWVT